MPNYLSHKVPPNWNMASLATSLNYTVGGTRGIEKKLQAKLNTATS